MSNSLQKRDLSKLKVAIVTDWMFSPGGMDRFIKSIRNVVPNSVVYTAVYLPKNYENSWFMVDYEVRESLFGMLPFKSLLYRYLNVLLPYAFENLDLSGFDLVISVSAGSAKGVITDVDQPHLGIIATPPRFVWDNDSNLRALTLRHIYKVGAPFVRLWLRIWDQVAVRRIDKVVGISKFIQRKIKKTYKRDSDLLYPALDDWWFKPLLKGISHLREQLPQKYFLAYSRMYDYKRLDWAILAAIKSGEFLVVAGDGPDRPALEKLAKGHPNIIMLGAPSNNDLKSLLIHAQAFIFCGIEDFGIVTLEAMACGTPVLAYNGGGVVETNIAGVTGEFFNDIDGLAREMTSFDRRRYNSKDIVARAKEFTEEMSNLQLSNIINDLLDEFQERG